MELSSKAKNLEGIRRVCRPAPLVGKELETFFVETDMARDPHQETRKRLIEALNSREDARLLFYGHRGCGKSTELNKLLAEHKERFLPVTFSVHDQMSSAAICAEDLILIIAERVLNAAKNNNLEVDDDLLEPVLAYFNETTRTTAESRDSHLKVGAGVSSKAGLLGPLLKVFARLSAQIKLEAHSKETTVALLRKRPSDLLVQANNVIEAVRKPLLKKNLQLLIIVEDLDKLELMQAREMYVNHVNLLTGITANIIYTIPIFLFHSPDVNAFKYHFDDVVALPMIKVTDPEGQPAPGFDTVKKIIMQRIEDNLINEDALDRLVTMTGGVLRHAFDVLHTAAVMVNARVPLEQEHINYGLNQLRKDFWQQITLPFHPLPDGPESVDDLYNRLADYGRKQQKGEKPRPVSDSVNQLLLKSCALVEYNGEGWFGVHPLVIENLKDLGRLS